MARMKRKQIYLEAEQDRRLRALSRRQRRSESELIREGIRRVLDEPPLDRTAWEREKAFIESLIRKGPIPGGRTWKREDLYDER
jgi:Arc/MetJ-type ribon-helix-helix transcriptional regulator